MLSEFGKFLRKYRVDHGILLKDMAKDIKMTPTYLSYIEHGKRVPPKNMLARLGQNYIFTIGEQKELREKYVLVRNAKKIQLKDFILMDRVILLMLMEELPNMPKEKKDKIIAILKE